MNVGHRGWVWNHADLGDILARAGGGPKAGGRRASARSWFEIRNAQRGGEGASYAEIYLYDEIGMWGVGAADFVGQLNELDVDEIDLHINSPGGDLFDGVAIYQALVANRADIFVYVDSLAASIASVIAMAGDKITMAPMSRMFIHDAWGACVGNSSDMRQMAAQLDDFSGMIAGAYSARAGGTSAQWRKKMQAESWFSPQDAVAEGLADEVAKPSTKDEEAAAAKFAPAAARRKHDPGSFPWLRPAAEGDDAGEPEAPPASPAPETPAPDPQPVDEPGEEEPGDFGDLNIAALITSDLAPPPLPTFPEGLVTGTLRDAWHDAPASPAPTPPAPGPEPAPALLTALQEDLIR